MIRLVTDSGSMLPAELRRRFTVDVVPLTVTIDGVLHHEGVDITTAEFYARLAAGATVTTSAPSPGEFVAAYERAEQHAASGAVSIHTGSNYSATVAAATVANELVPIPVTIVDTGLASFPVALCVWAAGAVLADGADAAAAAAAALATAASTRSVFVVGVPELARRGGRFTTMTGKLTPTSVLELGPDGLRVTARVADVEAAIDAMVSHVANSAEIDPLRVGVGHAERPELAAVLIERLDAVTGVVELVPYEVGPSVGAHTGAGTIGVVYCPRAP